MSTNFKTIPADEWIEEFYSDELKADRKADKPARYKACNFSEAFTALMYVGGVNPFVHQTLHVFLGKSRGLAPDEEIKFFSEKDAGALLPAKDPTKSVNDASLRKRFVRAWDETTEEMARTGKRFAGSRVDGAIRFASKTADEKKTAPKYYSEIAQAVVDVERLANQKRGMSRAKRFSEAAIEVWNKLPAYVAPASDKAAKLSTVPDAPAERLSGKRTNAARRWDGATNDLIATSDDLDALEQMLIEQLKLKFAAARGEVNDSSSDNTIVDNAQNEAAAKTKSECTNSFEASQNTEEKREVEGSHVDKVVHVDPCVACGVEMSESESKINTELCELCRPPDRLPGELPITFRLIQEQELKTAALSGLRLAPDKASFDEAVQRARDAGASEQEINDALQPTPELTYEPEPEYEEGVM